MGKFSEQREKAEEAESGLGLSEDRNGFPTLTVQSTLEWIAKSNSESARRLCSLCCLLFNCMDAAENRCAWRG